MTTNQYSTLLSLYKKKVTGNKIEDERKIALLDAEIALDRAFIESKQTSDIKEYIHELVSL